MFTVNLFYVSVVATYWFNTCFGVHTKSKKVNLPLSEEITIQSPGYPWKNYESDTIYTWMVTAPDITEEIDIRIELDIHHTKGYLCYDYLKIQEIEENIFTLFNRCGQLQTNRVANGNRLKIILFSNHDRFTAKGFRLSLKVSKISTRATIKTTLTTTTLPLSKISMSAAAIKTTTTTSTKTSFPNKTKTRSTQLTTPLTLSKISTRATIKTTLTTTTLPLSKISMSAAAIKTTTTTSTKTSFPHKTRTRSTQLIMPLSKISTRSTIKTTLATTTIPLSKISMTQETKTTATKPTKISFPQKAKTRNKPTIPKLLSTRTPLTTEVTTKRTIKTNFPNRTTTQQTTSKNILSKFLSSAPGTLNSPLPPLSSTAEIVKTSKTTHVVITTDLQHMITSEIQNSSSTKLIAGTTPMPNGPIFSRKMVILMVGVVVVEVTIIIVGILVVRRCRQQRNNTRPNKANDRRAVSNVYATSPDEACDENQYKDVSEGVYDTTLKRRSHVNCSSNEYSTGSFYSRMFRGSNNDRRRPIEENLPMS